MWFLCVCGFASVSLGVFACMCVCVYIGGGRGGRHVWYQWHSQLVYFECYRCMFMWSGLTFTLIVAITVSFLRTVSSGIHRWPWFSLLQQKPQKKEKEKKDTHTYTHTHTHKKAHRKDPNINKSGAKVQRLETSFAYPGQTSFAYPGHLHACQNQRSCNWELA